MSKKVSNNRINSIEQSWSHDEETGLPYSGDSVEDFIKREGIAKAQDAYESRVGATWFDPSTMTGYSFHSEEDKLAFISGDRSVWYLSTPFEFSGTINQVRVVNNLGSTSLYYTTTSTEARLSVGFSSQQKAITDMTWDEVYEDFEVTVYVDKGSTGNWATLLSTRVKNGESLDFDVRKQIQSGGNRVRVVAVGETTRQTGTLIYNVTLTTMYLQASKFAWNVPFVEDEEYALGGMNIGGALQKTLKVMVSRSDGSYLRTYEQNIGTSTYVNTSYYFRGLEFPDAGTGVYDVEVWLDAAGLESEHLRYQLICVSKADVQTARLIAVAETPATLKNYENNTLCHYVVYNGGMATASPTIHVATDLGTLIEETLGSVPTGTINSYVAPVEVETDDESLDVRGSMTYGNTVDMTFRLDNSAAFPAVAGSVFYLQPGSRSNAQENRRSIINQSTGAAIGAEWTRVDFVDGVDGYTEMNGRKCLHIPALSKVSIDYRPLATLINGKTIDLTFMTDNVADYDKPVLTICDKPGSADFRGIVVYPDRVVVHTRDLNTNDLSQSYTFGEGRLTSLQVSYAKNYKTSYGNLITIAVNGVKKCEFPFSSSDNIGGADNIIIGGDSADISLYALRVYDTAFDTPEIMQNYIASLGSTAEKYEAFTKIESAIDDSYKVDYDKVKGVYNTMVIEMLNGAERPHYGLSKKYTARCNLWIDILDEDADKTHFSGEYLDEEVSGQGTTSMNYWEWNNRWKKLFMALTAKKNYASGMQSHKMGATAAYNDLHEALELTNETGGRVAVYQYPVLGFEKVWVEDTKEYVYEFIGLFTIGPDKGDKATFGWSHPDYKDKMLALEGLDHNVMGAGYNYPYDRLHYDINEESIVNDAGESATEVTNSGSAETEAGIQAKLDAEYKPAYECAYQNNPLIKGTTATLEEMNADTDAWGQQKDADGHAYQRFEFWRDGEYDILFLCRGTHRYEKSGVNLLTQLGITEAELAGLTMEEKNALFIRKRVERFKVEAPKYFHIEDCMFGLVYKLMFGAKDNGIKNTYPYKFGTLAEGSRWRFRDDDLDSLFDKDNQGLSSAKFWCEWADFSDESRTAYVFKGEQCVLFQLLLLAFPDVEKDIAHRMFDKMQELSKYGSTSIEKLVGFFRTYFFDKAQLYFPKSAYNKDVEYAYEDAWPHYTDGSYDVDAHPLSQVVGDDYERELAWIEKRMVYLMSKYQYGPFGAGGYNDTSLGRINFRTQIAQSFTLTPAIPLYPAVANGVNTLNVTERVMAGETATIAGVGGTNTNVYIMAADYLSDIGDLSGLQVDSNSEATLSVASKRLRQLKVGNTENAVTSNLSGLNIGACPSLEVVLASHLVSLTGEVDLSRCPRLREVYFYNTNVRNVVIPRGSKLQKLHLSQATTTISLVDTAYITTFLAYSLNKVEYLRLENCSVWREILSVIGVSDTLRNVRITGISGEVEGKYIGYFARIARQCHGITADGVSDDGLDPVIEGELHVSGGSMQEEDYELVVAAFPSLKLTRGETAGYFHFADAEVNRILAKNWGDGVGISLEEINGVKELGTVFSGSSIETFDELELFQNLQSPGKYSNCVKLRSIKLPPNITNFVQDAFNNCISLGAIEIPESVVRYSPFAFANCTQLNPNIPVNAEEILEYAFSKCGIGGVLNLPNLVTLGNYAFAETQIESIENLGKISTIPMYAFLNCKALQSVNIPETVANIQGYAFQGATSLGGALSLPNIASIGTSAFNNTAITRLDNLKLLKQLQMSVIYNCPNLEYVDLSMIEVIGAHAIRNTPKLNMELNIPNLRSIGAYAFYMSGITNVVNLGSVQTIPENCFSQCQSLESVCLPESVEKLETHAFSHSSLTQINLSESLTTISDLAFDNCSKLEIDALRLPNLEYLGSRAFQYTKVKRIEDLGKVTEIQDYTFHSCTLLTHVDLSELVTSIGNAAFFECLNLRTFIVRAIVPPALGTNINSIKDANIYVPDQSLEAYRTADIWNTIDPVKFLPLSSYVEENDTETN